MEDPEEDPDAGFYERFADELEALAELGGAGPVEEGGMERVCRTRLCAPHRGSPPVSGSSAFRLSQMTRPQSLDAESPSSGTGGSRQRSPNPPRTPTAAAIPGRGIGAPPVPRPQPAVGLIPGAGI